MTLKFMQVLVSAGLLAIMIVTGIQSTGGMVDRILSGALVIFWSVALSSSLDIVYQQIKKDFGVKV